MKINYDSPAAIAAFLRERDLRLKKRFGQNFLINPGIREKLLDLLNLSGEETVWEIGPGIGSLTAGLLERSAKLTVFEIDWGFIRVLRELFPGLSIVPGDVVHTWPQVFDSKGMPDRVSGNLPYGSGAAIILSFIKRRVIPERMVFTVQKEQAERMAAVPGNGAYSSFSVLCTGFYQVEQKGDIKQGSFFPRPEVMSRIVVLTPNRDLEILYPDIFVTLTGDLFRKKRKTIRNNLESGTLQAETGKDLLFSVFEQCSVSLSRRAEELSAEIIAACADTLGHRLNRET